MDSVSVYRVLGVNMLDCIECGCCAYTCPASVPLVLAFKAGKHAMKEAAMAAKK